MPGRRGGRPPGHVPEAGIAHNRRRSERPDVLEEDTEGGKAVLFTPPTNPGV